MRFGIRQHWEIGLALLIALALRAGYVSVTAWDERGHDFWGHADYIEYIAEHAKLPPPHDGWQFYQPPLYYVLMAPIFSVMRAEGYDRDDALRAVQWAGFLVAAATLIFLYWTAFLLFPDTRPKRFAFLLFAGIMPSFVFVSARINNDVLHQFLSFAATALMLWWWRKPSWRRWMILCVVIGLGMLTKSNMLLLLVSAVALALFAKPLSWRVRFEAIALLTVITFGIAGWRIIPPYFEKGASASAVVGNAEQMTGPIPNTPEFLLTFNPVQVLRHPYNAIVGEDARRLYHAEYVYRSMYFGEFDFGNVLKKIAFFILLFSLMLIPFQIISFWGTFRAWTKTSIFPLVILAPVLLSGALLFRIALPYSSSQDFRYSLPLLIPFVYFALQSEHRWSSRIRLALTSLLAVLCAIFLIMLIGREAIS